jgi:hypothetical protein
VVVGVCARVLGILRYRRLSYWRWVGAMVLWQTAAQFLFASFGSLEHPERDGLVIRAVRQATDDGPAVAIVGLVFIVVFWGGTIYFLRQFFKDARQPAAGVYGVKPATWPRKAAELTALTLAIGALFYLNFSAARAPAQAEPAPETVEAIIDREVATLNASAPKRLDDITVLTHGTREGEMLVIHYRISPPKELATRAAFEAAVREQHLPPMCAETSMQQLLQTGAKARLRYTIPNEAHASRNPGVGI